MWKAVEVIMSIEKCSSLTLEEMIEEVHKFCRNRDYESAMRLADEAVKTYSGESKSWRLRSYIHALKSDFTAAIDDVSKAIAIEAGATLLFCRGRYRFKLGHYVPAIEDFRLAINAPDAQDESFHHILYFWRAHAYIKLGKKQEASEDIALIPDDLRTWTDELLTKADLVEKYSQLSIA